MAWWQIKLFTSKDLAEQWSDILLATGASAVTLNDKHSQAIFEPVPGSMPIWQQVQLVALYPLDSNIDFISAQIRSYLGADLALDIETIAEQDWQETWKENLKPMQFGNKLWICQSWAQLPDPAAINIILDPGLGFGTGTHPTTAMCLEWLATNLPANSTVLDFGCGSGILGIAAVKLGAGLAYCVDCDQQALQTTRENADKNAINAEQLLTLDAEQLPNALLADVVVANILANPLSELAASLASYVKPAGNIILSGILLNQADALLDIYQQWFTDLTVTAQDEWVRITGVKICK